MIRLITKRNVEEYLQRNTYHAKFKAAHAVQGRVMRPNNYEDMIRLSEFLAWPLDFIRVDLYNVDGRVLVGELTSYPGAGIERFIPRKYDFIFGEIWKMN